MSDNLVEKMKQRIMDIINPDVEYSQEDFNKEFNKTISTDSYKLELNFVNTSINPNPEYATAGSSGFDLRASLPEAITIPAGKRAIVPTGLFFKIPDNFEITVRSRSGLAAKNGVVVLNSPGTIDSDYNGEVKVILINHGEEPFTINNGDRIAQAVLTSVISKSIINLLQVDKLSTKTERNGNGFGSTGIN
jgi:dUTP pyrophosphatase